MNKVFMGVEEIDFEVVFQSWSFKFLWKVVIKIFQNEKRNKKILNFRVTCWIGGNQRGGNIEINAWNAWAFVNS